MFGRRNGLPVPSSLDAFFRNQDSEQLREARLDCVITQLDVSRMARNASRHLDVESILALPTITYRNDIRHEKHSHPCNPKDDLLSTHSNYPTLAGKNTVFEDSCWSWQMIPAPPSLPHRLSSDEGQNDGSRVHDEQDSSFFEEEEHQVCVICLESFQEGSTLRLLPCGHAFHMGCIDHWLLGTFSDDECFTSGCPTCKKHPMPMTEELDGLDKNENLEAAVEMAMLKSTASSTLDGSLPSWAFARLGDALANKDMIKISEKQGDEHIPNSSSSNHVIIGHERWDLDASLLSESGMLSITSSATNLS